MKKILFYLANILLFGALSRRRARAKAEAEGIITREFNRLLSFRKVRRRLHVATIWKALNENSQTRRLPRRIRRQAARNAGYYAFRQERGLPDIDSKSHRRRLRRGYFPPSLLLPITVEDTAPPRPVIRRIESPSRKPPVALAA